MLGVDHVVHHPNHTGPGKLSFTASRGSTALWVRVAADAEEAAALARWAASSSSLEAYAAPPVLDVATVDGRTTLVLPHLPDPVATRATFPESAVLSVIARLHADRDLASRLGPPVTAREAFTSVWVERFEADLDVVEGFLARDEHVFLADEVAALVDALAAPAFDVEVHAAVHGDPWHENVLLRPGHDPGLWLLDWEDLAVGDPVVDEAIALAEAHGPHGDGWPDGERYDVASHCLVLDGIVDVAADWVEATDPVVRAAKEAAYRSALAAYRD